MWKNLNPLRTCRKWPRPFHWQCYFLVSSKQIKLWVFWSAQNVQNSNFRVGNKRLCQLFYKIMAKNPNLYKSTCEVMYIYLYMSVYGCKTIHYTRNILLESEVQYRLDASYNAHACFTRLKRVLHVFETRLSLREHAFAAACTRILCQV